jgi:hypothetical protein
MDLQKTVEHLLLKWEDAPAGKKPPLELLCADYPQLIDHVRDGIRRLEGVNRVLSPAVSLSTGALKPQKKAAMPPGKAAAPRIEGYEIVDRLGEGGMGVVWRAVQKSTRRQVALKLMNVALLGSQR